MNTKGFTLIELISTLVLVSIVAALAVTSSSHFVRKNQQQVILDELQTAIQYSKIQAVNLGRAVYLKPLDPAKNWSKGMTLSTLNKKTNKSEDLYQWQWHHPQWLITWKGVASSDKITLSNNPVNAISNGKFVLLNISTKEQQIITLNRIGRMRIATR